MEKGISIRSYNRAKEMLQEADTKLVRAHHLSKKGDYCGAIEASQHCVEIAIKSLFKLVSLDPPFTHDPGKSINKVFEVLGEKIRLCNNLSNTMEFYYRPKFLSHLLERFHTEGMYGYEDIPSSKIFIEKDADYFIYCAFDVYFSCLLILLIVGYNFGFLSNKERIGMETIMGYSTRK